MTALVRLGLCGLCVALLYGLTGGRLWARWPGWCMAGIVFVLLVMGGMAVGVRLAQDGR